MPVPEAAVKAIAAGCDAVLVCSGNHDLQAATLEALIRAVEQDELPYPRVEQALAHQRAAKERFLGDAPAVPRRTPPNAASLRQVVGMRRAPGSWRPDWPGSHERRAAASRARCARATRLALVAPASPFDRAEFDAGVDELRALGFDPTWDESRCSRGGDSLRATGGDARRRLRFAPGRIPASPVSSASAAGTAASRCCRSSTRARFAPTPKAFIGYSDLTSLLTFLIVPVRHRRVSRARPWRDVWARARAPTTATPSSACADRRGTAGRDGGRQVETLRTGEARGRLLGGTLTQLAAAAGTPYALAPWDDTILLLEDVGERPYRLDRLRAAAPAERRVRRTCAASCSGTFPRCDEPGGALTAREVPWQTCSPIFGPGRVRLADRPCRSARR